MSENTEDTINDALATVSTESPSTTIGLTMSACSTIGNKDDGPRILCNELIVNPHKSKSFEKLDELSSLEREIAKMHHVDVTNLDIEGSSIMGGEKQSNQIQMVHTLTLDTSKSTTTNENHPSDVRGLQNANVIEDKDIVTSCETALEHEDLIAVLKGLDNNVDEAPNNCGPDSILDGVTIEGEGEYQIMEVVDEDSNATEETAKPDDIPTCSSNPVVQNLNKKRFGSTLLTAEEEKALALEQIEGLKIVHRSRKQDIKPIKQVDPSLELVSTLEADWSEHEEEICETIKSDTKTKQPSNKSKAISKNIDKKITSSLVILLPSVAGTSASAPTTTVLTNPSIKNDSSNSYNKSKSDEVHASKSTPTDDVVEAKSGENTQPAPSQSGFRRTRIIKRKIIWDPDAPETTFSYAKLVKPNNNKVKNEQNSTTLTKKGSTTITPFKKEVQPTPLPAATKKIQRPTTPKGRKSATDLNIEKSSNLSKTENNNLVKNIAEKIEDPPAKAAQSLESKSSSPTTSPNKRRSQTPVSNGSSSGVGVKKKKITELDRLMGDEGAVNMLNSLEKLEATLGPSEMKSTRPMMRSRAATICEKLPRKEVSPVSNITSNTSSSAPNVQANKGKRTPKSRASASWDYVYKKKKQDFEDSLIIRRRSNSSYSSTTSQSRLSLDGPPSSIANNNNTSISSAKSNESISVPASTNENGSPNAHPSASNNNKSLDSSKSRSTTTPPPGKTFEFAKPESKKSQKRTKSPVATTLTNDMKKAAPTGTKRIVRSPAVTNEDKGKDVIKTLPMKSPTNIKDRKEALPPSGTISDVVVKKSSKVAQILFSNNKAKMSNTFTIQMLHKLVDILDNLAADPDCNVVVIGTNDAHFCQGIDITDLTTIAAEKRKNYAVNLATSTKNYLKTLATYPKPIVAGVSGNIMNLGVIQLALFDIVIASDKSTFEAPYCKMGQTPEGYCIWHNMNKIRGSFKTKLFWLCEKVQSTEAALAGLVNKLTISNKVNEEALMTAKRIASLSAESHRAMKKTVTNSHMDIIGNSLDEEFSTIIKQWTSSECLENLKKYIARD